MVCRANERTKKMLYTYQDFEEAQDVPKFVLSAIERYKQSDMYQTACIAD